MLEHMICTPTLLSLLLLSWLSFSLSLFTDVFIPTQSTPQVKAQLPSNATACYALAVSADGKVNNMLLAPTND